MQWNHARWKKDLIGDKCCILTLSSWCFSSATVRLAVALSASKRAFLRCSVVTSAAVMLQCTAAAAAPATAVQLLVKSTAVSPAAVS
jgi:hypothetical protein